MNASTNIALKAAREAGRFIAQAADRLDTNEIARKGQHDYVTETDTKAEAHIIETIREAYPQHSFLGEEFGQSGAEDNDNLWIIDPIDGTTNFIHGIPHYAISIALQHKGKLEAAVIYDPIKNEEFVAARGQGAQLNGKRIRVSQTKVLSDAVIGTGFPFKKDQEPLMDAYFEQAKNIAKATAGIRRAGAASLDLAYVAAGRYDGFWEYGLQKWDIAAGILLVQEAGGLLGEPQGGLDYFNQGNIVCANSKLFKPLLQTLNAKT